MIWYEFGIPLGVGGVGQGSIPYRAEAVQRKEAIDSLHAMCGSFCFIEVVLEGTITALERKGTIIGRCSSVQKGSDKSGVTTSEESPRKTDAVVNQW